MDELRAISRNMFLETIHITISELDFNSRCGLTFTTWDDTFKTTIETLKTKNNLKLCKKCYNSLTKKEK